MQEVEGILRFSLRLLHSAALNYSSNGTIEISAETVLFFRDTE